jgi:hypothetical protein
MKKIKLNFAELGMEVEVDLDKLKEARKTDNRGYATFNATDSEGEEIAIAGSKGNPVCVQILLNDTTVKSKGKNKAKRKLL